MISFFRIALELAFVGGAAFFLYKTLWGKLDSIYRIALVILCFCAIFISSSVASYYAPKRTVTLTALNTCNPESQENTISLIKIVEDGKAQIISEPISGSWTWYNNRYSWFDESDERRTEEMTDSISFELKIVNDTDIVFYGNNWKGMVLVSVDGEEIIVDTYSPDENGTEIAAELTDPSGDAALMAIAVSSLAFAVSFLIFVTAEVGVLFLIKRIAGYLIKLNRDNEFINKLLKYSFLFEELVKRDFKKKYKRTALGMGWSVLSPLLTLFIMRVVFTRFFGGSTIHYTIFLFCGNLVFSYFNESTTQGMTSLVSNASIFSKVNIPKYLFLLAKNVQTMINFGLTLCVFFLFCILDGVEFTWKFVLLIYPIFTLMLLNLGIGQVLSALFVFFQDIQYLWSVFTMLLMYASAIFYNVDAFGETLQKLFLLNPVYLHISYFREIVINGTIPSVWIHLLMGADAAIVLGVGCWMYKKYNTKFLYYV